MISRKSDPNRFQHLNKTHGLNFYSYYILLSSSPQFRRATARLMGFVFGKLWNYWRGLSSQHVAELWNTMVSRPIKVNYVTILYCVPSVLDEICRECNELFWLDCPHIFTFKRVCFLAMIRAFRLSSCFRHTLAFQIDRLMTLKWDASKAFPVAPDFRRGQLHSGSFRRHRPMQAGEPSKASQSELSPSKERYWINVNDAKYKYIVARFGHLHHELFLSHKSTWCLPVPRKVASLSQNCKWKPWKHD